MIIENDNKPQIEIKEGWVSIYFEDGSIHGLSATNFKKVVQDALIENSKKYKVAATGYVNPKDHPYYHD